MEKQQSQSSVNNRNEQLEGWTKEEKLNLLQALKQHGSEDVSKLWTYLPTKSEDEIKNALEFYINRASSPSAQNERKKRKPPHSPVIPLAGWAKLLTDSLSFDELQTDIAAALRLIAEFEDRPPAACTENYDFKKIYLMIADALEGKSLEDDDYARSMIDQCVLQTALNSKTSLRNAKIKELLGSVSLTEREIKFLTKPTNEADLVCLRSIINNKNYNPLNVSEPNCKLLNKK